MPLPLPYFGTLRITLRNKYPLVLHSWPPDFIASELYWRGEASFEPEVISLIEKLMPYTTTFLDVGANVGFLSLLASKMNPSATIYSFEPHPRVFRSLKKNIELNQAKNIFPQQLAVGKERGTLDFFVPKGFFLPLSASLSSTFRNNTKKISVRVESIDNWVESQKLQKIDLIKIDTEGCEAAVIEGATNTLRQFKPRLICEILSTDSYNLVSASLSTLGYSLFHMTESYLTPGFNELGVNQKKYNYYGKPEGDTLTEIEAIIEK